MKLPFVSRKKHDSLMAAAHERIADLTNRLIEKDCEINMEICALREALFHRNRADKLEKFVLAKQAPSHAQTFWPASHNATPQQPETAPPAQNPTETDDNDA